MKICCINLDRRPDRWARMQTVAAAAGIVLSRVAAVDGAAPGFADLSRHMRRDGPVGQLSDRTVACTLSHIRAWRSFLDDPARPEYLVVLEDDVELSRDFRAVIDDLETRALLGHDIIKLEIGGTMHDGVVIADGPQIAGGRRVCRVFQVVTDSGAYMISRDSAARLMACETAICTSVDHFLFYPVRRRGFWGGRCGVVVQPVARQDRSITSDIAVERFRGGRLARDLHRLIYEGAQLPVMLAGIIGSGARVRKLDYDPGCAPPPPP